MSAEKHTGSSPGDSKAKKPAKAQLNEQDLAQVSGGAIDAFLTLDGIKGESADIKHKDPIE
jgi:hypothetical protein